MLKPLKDEFKIAGSKLFEGRDVFFNLQRILLDMLRISIRGTIYLVVDGLDECDSELSKLLCLITNRVAPPSRVRWLITSRNREDIEQQLRSKDLCLTVSLELNSSCVSHAVDTFVNIKVQ